ncbi:MAG: FKBP-type peptidyl-prolyl cis-trans isomerase [Bacteroidetes bacterium]|nr:MAG: FKBP-type peptidyl-prolyl cis-trans isomerase [Bacteroidota bacterium]REK00057.1 MAG: FKBP-type peptidyl-prolyl cis-trans isomerase [Bacteroidota bacterium]REK32935.1 MAG: FKBP-type peptidyl-prolyl cis-trans isomerase [Bacteroidota bacterium]REK47742.1 MAG: FKBP-type peptidyl-prolyl cis-trans isomerase [Bacteroidota bacterium]
MNNKVLLLAACFSLATLFSCNGQKGKTQVSLKNAADSVAYGIGVSIGSNMKKDGLDSLNLDVMKAGIHAALKGDSLLLTGMQAQDVIQEYLTQKQSQKSARNKESGQKFLEENKKKSGVITLPSGLQYMVITDGKGPKPSETDTVETHYHGTLIDGTVFDSSVERGEPVEFPVNAVIPGWTEALQLMNVGSKWKLFIPSDLAYGDRQAGPDIMPHSALVFEVELISIKGK